MINEFIKNRRIELSLSRKTLCDGLCSESTLYRFESGVHDINSYLLVELCKRLNLENIVITDIDFSEKEYTLFLLIQNYIYKQNIIELENILESLKSEKLNKDWIKIKFWCEAVICFYKKEYDSCEDIIINEININNPKTSLDLLILNTLTLTNLSKENYIKALESAKNCIYYLDTHYIESIEINTEIKYSYAYSLFKNNQKIEAEKIVLELVESLLCEKTFFMLGKCYFFLYILFKDKNTSTAQKYLKRAYMAFIIEQDDVPKQVTDEMNHLKDTSLYF